MRSTQPHYLTNISLLLGLLIIPIMLAISVAVSVEASFSLGCIRLELD
jgi:hypothetical protein